MDNALNRNIIIGLYNDIFDHRQGNTIIYYIISIFCIELKTLILLPLRCGYNLLLME